MDFKTIKTKLIASLGKFWAWLKPYLLRAHQWRKRIWKQYHVNKVIILLGLVVVLVMSIYLFMLAKSQNVETLKAGLAQVTTIYDEQDEEAGTLYKNKGTFVEFDHISPHIVSTLVATEDRRFYQHKGFDLRGIARAVVGKLTGRNAGGGSTITQQLAKNAYLTLDPTFDRKAKELFLAIEIEKAYSKNEILEMYLNNAYFANGVWGVEDASHKYFAKSAAELNVSEAAVLVGMLKGPEIYNPINHPEYAKDRRDTVLQILAATGKLSQEEAKALEAEEIVTQDNYVANQNSNQYPGYFDAVINEAENMYKISAQDLLNKGYKVYTGLNQQYQQDMDTTFNNDGLFPPNAEDGEMVQAASIALNPKTGAIQAVYGGRGERNFRDLNRATQSYLSPGSTMKPLSVYTPALEAGYTPDSILKDEELSYYDVRNYDHTYRGDVPMYQALAESLNPSAVWLLNKIGIETGAKKAEKFGIQLEKEDHYYGLALGGLTKGTTPLKMASAYAVFANQGQQKEAHFIRKIVDASGAVIVNNEDAKVSQVTSKEVANEMTSMLQGVFSSGTGYNAQPYGYAMAGKTGTTETVNVDAQSKDQWVIGYTPDVVLASWIGFDKSSETHYLTNNSSQGISFIFKDQAQRILAHSPGTDFQVGDASLEAQKNEEKKPGVDGLGEFGEKVKEGAQYWGDRIKEGAGIVSEGLKDWWQSLTE